MTLLSREEIITAKIVQKNPPTGATASKGLRSTTYDATIGEIFGSDGTKVEKDIYMLAPRGIAWIVSAETYCLPQNVTGITTLKTGWTKQGVLTLTVGIVDPGYKGPLSTQVINFSKKNFMMQKGAPFFRTAFFSHEKSNVPTRDEVPRHIYETQVQKSTTDFSATFLNMDTLASELTEKMFALPRWAFKFAIVAMVLGVFGIIVSLGIDISKNISAKDAKIDALEERLKAAEEKIGNLKPKR